MKFYLVQISDVFDFDDYSPKPIPYKSLDKAKAKLKELRYEFFKENFPNDWIVAEDNDNCFSTYQEGRYAEMHYKVFITELELED